MDRWTVIEQINQAERLIAECERLIETKRRIITELEISGEDTTQARSLLQTVEASYDRYLAHRDELRRTLDELPSNASFGNSFSPRMADTAGVAVPVLRQSV